MKQNRFVCVTDVAIAAEMANAIARGESIGIDSRHRESSVSLSQSHRPVGIFTEFLYDVNPINLHDWRKSSILIRSLLVLRAPAMFLLQLLVPVVNETAINRGWSKLLNCLQLCITPIVALFKLNGKVPE